MILDAELKETNRLIENAGGQAERKRLVKRRKIITKIALAAAKPCWKLDTPTMLNYAHALEHCIPLEQWRSHAHPIVEKVTHHYFIKRVHPAPNIRRLLAKRLIERQDVTRKDIDKAIIAAGGREKLLAEADRFKKLLAEPVHHLKVLMPREKEINRLAGWKAIPERLGDLYNNKLGVMLGYIGLFEGKVRSSELF